MADVIAIVAAVIATIAFCYIVVDVITTCFWLMLLPSVWWLMLLPSVTDGIATFMWWADVIKEDEVKEQYSKIK